MGTAESAEFKEKFHFIDHNDAQEFRFQPSIQPTSLETKKTIKESHHGPSNGHIGEYTGLNDFILPEKYVKYMQESKQYLIKDPLKCEDPKIESFSGYDPYMFKKSLNVYHGEWKNGQPHGYGKIFNPDRDFYYEGYFEEGLPSHYGVYIADKIVYRGEFKLGRAEGRGVYKEENTLIEGEFKQNFPYKNCREKGENYEFQGEFENNKWKKGILNWDQDKSQYEGEFLDGIIHGKGFLKTQQYIYEGEFKNGKKHGEGKIYWKEGYSYQGQFMNDEINGNGEYMKDLKLIYRGEFENGKAKGEGCVSENQMLIHAVWNNGEASSIS